MDTAIDGVLDRLATNSHLTRLYHSYLSRFVKDHQELQNHLETLVLGDEIATDYEKMYLLGSLLNAEHIQHATVNRALHWLKRTTPMAEETKAIAAVFAAKYGNAQQRNAVRVAYEDQPSHYVKSAILYSSQFLTTAEKKNCKLAWGGHSMLNTLMVQAI